MTLEQQDLVPGWLWHVQTPKQTPQAGQPQSQQLPCGCQRGAGGAVWEDPSSHPNIPSLPSRLPVQWHHHESPRMAPGHPLTGGDKAEGPCSIPLQLGTGLQHFPLPTFVKGLIPKELLSATWCRCSIVLGMITKKMRVKLPPLPALSTPSHLYSST